MPLQIADDALSMEYYRRLQSYHRGTTLIIVGAFVSLALPAVTLADRYALAVDLPLLLVIFAVGAVFASKVWRCPACSRPFTRAHRNRCCEHCGMQFSLTPPAESKIRRPKLKSL